jgi:hypothetical protein
MGARYSAPVHTGPGAHPASYTMGTGVKRPGRDFDHPSSAEVNVKSKAILLLPFWAFVACYRVTFTFIGTTDDRVLSLMIHKYKDFITVVPPYPLIQYPRFNAARKKMGKLKK